MAEGEQKTEAPKEHPAMGQIVGYLKDYPFLLITIAGLLILSGILIFEIEKLKEFKWLIYAVVLVPLAIQFLIEFKKMTPRQERPAQPSAPAPYPPPSPPIGMLPPNRKAWISVGIGMLLFGVVAASPEAELYDQEFALGFLVVALVAAGFAVAGMSDVKRQRAGGKGTAITGIVLSSVLLLAALGWMTDAPTPVPSSAVDAATPVPPPSGAGVTPPQAALPPMAPASPVQPQAGNLSLEGRYQLLAHQINGVPQASGGALAVFRQPSGQYQWQAQLIVQDVNDARIFVYSGQLLNRGGRWFIRISGSNDPNWEDLGEMPMELVSDGRNTAFSYVYDGDLVQSAWARSQ